MSVFVFNPPFLVYNSPRRVGYHICQAAIVNRSFFNFCYTIILDMFCTTNVTTYVGIRMCIQVNCLGSNKRKTCQLRKRVSVYEYSVLPRLVID